MSQLMDALVKPVAGPGLELRQVPIPEPGPGEVGERAVPVHAHALGVLAPLDVAGVAVAAAAAGDVALAADPLAHVERPPRGHHGRERLPPGAGPEDGRGRGGERCGSGRR